MRSFVEPWPRRTPGLGFRAVTDADLPFLRDLYASTRAEELSVVAWPDAAKRAFLDEQFGLQDRHYRANYPGADFLVIEFDSAPVGRIYVYRTDDEIRVMDIALVPSKRGAGFGTSMFDELFEEARGAGKSISLHVEAHNPAQRLYARLGFVFEADRGPYQLLRWVPTPAV